MRTLFPTCLLVSVFLASASPGQPVSGDDLIDLRFRGGTAAQYIAAIREAAGDLNILVAPEAADVLMPPVNLKHVSVAAAIRLLEDEANETPDRRVWLIVTELPLYATGEQQTYQVSAQIRSHRKRIPDAYVWTVSNLLGDTLSSKAVLSAVEMALDVVNSKTAPDVRFHEDTGLLIATGDVSQMETIDGVLSRLGDAAAERRERESLEEVVALRHELARMELLDAELRRMLRSKEQELTQTRELLRTANEELHRRDTLPRDQPR
jgi:hypothetical protein